MKPGQTIKLQLVAENGEPLRLERVFSSIGFFTGGNYRYGFRLKATDENGQLIVNYNEIEEKKRRKLKGIPDGL